MLKKQQSSKT